MARSGKYAQLTVAAWSAKRAKVKAKACNALAKSAKDEPAVALDDGPALKAGYSWRTKDELVEELKARELPHTGNKEELITRLEEDDEANSQNEE